MRQIVIKIPDSLYEKIQNLTFDELDGTDACIFIKNGTPLPKGHGRLIDANKVDTAIYEYFEGIQFYDGTGFDIYQEAKESIDKIHSIIEADKESEG